MDSQNPKLLFIYSLSKDSLTRNNLKKGHYDDSKSNLILGLMSVKIAIVTICIINIITQILFLLATTTNIINLTSDNKNIIRDVFLFLFHILTFTLLLISTFNLNEQLAKLGLLLYQILFWVHFSLIVIVLTYVMFSDTNIIINNNIQANSFAILLSLILLAIVEVYFIYICFIYTYNIIEGNDAFICGEYFNKYVENLASSRASSSLNTPSRNNFKEFKDDLN